MREQCNIFIRQEQVPLAKNEFVRLLDRARCTDSAQAESDSTTSEREKRKEKKKKRKSFFFHCSELSLIYEPGTEFMKVLTIHELM